MCKLFATGFGVATVMWALQQPPPDTEIFLAPLSVKADGLVVGPPINITNSPGYDNQPSFTPDGSAVLFTSIRGSDAGKASQTDIYQYLLASRHTVRLTNTTTSEYSPTVTPDGRHFSAVRVEADGTQRLWRFGLDGNNPELVLTDIKPVGYHAWAGPTTLALFILGTPPTLQIADTRTGKADVVAKDIGRTLQPIPGGGISFVTREPSADGSPGRFVISAVDVPSRSTSTLVSPVGTTEPQFAWTSSGLLLMADHDILYAWRRTGRGKWSRISDLSASGLKGVTRLAVSPRGDWIALVVAAP